MNSYQKGLHLNLMCRNIDMSNFAKRSSEMRRIIKNLSSIQIIMFAFLLVIIIGSILLTLPISSVNG